MTFLNGLDKTSLQIAAGAQTCYTSAMVRSTDCGHRFQLWFSMLDMGLALSLAGLRAQGRRGDPWKWIAARWQRERLLTRQAHLRLLKVLSRHETPTAS